MRWYLIVSDKQIELLKLPLQEGRFVIGPRVDDDMNIGQLQGVLEVSLHAVTIHLHDDEEKEAPSYLISKEPLTVGNWCIRAELDQGLNIFKGNTQSMHVASHYLARLPLRITLNGAALGTRSVVIDNGSLRMGSHDSNDYVIKSAFASSFHCVIFARENGWFVRDLDSKNGTFLNDVRTVEAAISPPAVLRVGDAHLKLESQLSQEIERSLTSLVGESAVMMRLKNEVTRFAATQAPVLVHGESGTGKELIARALHDQSPRKEAPFVAINCGALTDNLVESELFGHIKGAFTGASDRRMGAFLSANGGTLFLDEIGELPLELQPKLLRVLESGELKAVGEDKVRKVDVRLLTATHRDLKQAVAEGRFREDLYHRLSVLVIEVPPLRKRREDILALAHYFMNQMAPKERHVKLSEDTEKALLNHPLSGNARELRNMILRGLVLTQSNVLLPEDLGLSVEAKAPSSAPVFTLPESPKELNHFEKQAIISALKEAEGSRTKAAKTLGIARSTLYRKLEEHGLSQFMLTPNS